MKTIASATIYISAIVAANFMTSRWGLVPIGFGLMATAGTYAAGVALGARDVVQDATGRSGVIAAVTCGGALSWMLSSPALAIASTAAFVISEVADWAIYTPLRARGWARAVLASNTAGAVVDTLAFLALAGFPVTGQSVAGQLVGKILWTTVLPILAVKAVSRALPRNAIGSEGT